MTVRSAVQRVIAVLGVLALGHALAAQPWQEPAHGRRISILMPACQQQTLTTGLVFSGADFYRWTGFPCPPVGSLRLHAAAAAIPLQVEERDGTGRLAGKANGVLDDDDRVVFELDLTPKPQEIHLYYDGPVAPQPQPKSSVQVVSRPNDLYPLVLKSGELSIGLRGGGVEPGVNRIENHGRGALASFVWRGLVMADLRGNWGFYFPRTLASGVGAPPWSQPAVILDGPVRAVVETHCNDFVQTKDGQEVLKGNVTHYIALWSGCPVVDFDEFVDYTASDFQATWPYTCPAPVGKDLDEHDRLIVPLAGKAHVVDVKETKEHRLAHPWRMLYSTDNPEEGWFAWQDPVEKTGLATFYEPMSAIEFRQSWVTYRPALHPFVQIRTTPYAAPDTSLVFRDRALRCRSNYHRDIRYVALRDEAPDDLRTLYHLWGSPLDRVAKVGWPEAR